MMSYELGLQGHTTRGWHEDDLRGPKTAFHFDAEGARLDQVHQEGAYSFRQVSNLIVWTPRNQTPTSPGDQPSRWIPAITQHSRSEADQPRPYLPS